MRRALLPAVAVGLALGLAACGGGPSGTVMAPPTVTALAAGNDHSLAIDTLGNVWAWGSDGHGQLGDGTTRSAVPSPVLVNGLTGAEAAAAGDDFSLAVDTAGRVWAWGYNGYGQLGDGTTTERHTPVRVGGLGTVTRIAAGARHALALLGDGTVRAWGSNAYGQLGDGTGSDRHTPVRVAGLVNVVAVAAGARHSLALASDGTVWAWGGNASGQLGDGGTADSASPVQVVAAGGTGHLTGIVAIAAGGAHSLALASTGTVYAWGRNGRGQLGDGARSGSSIPVQVTGAGGAAALTGITAIAAGDEDSLALGGDGVVRAWGSNASGQLGDGTTNDRTAPVEVTGLTGVVGLAAGAAHVLALRRDGAASAWGNNLYGQLAIDTATLRSTVPVDVVLAP